MQQLSIKFMTFQMLLKKQKFRLAAIVSDDISQLIADFNVKDHLPHIFSPCMQAYATYVNEIVDAQQEKKDTLEWQSMKEIDKIDLNSSLNLNKQLNCTTNYVPLSN